MQEYRIKSNIKVSDVKKPEDMTPEELKEYAARISLDETRKAIEDIASKVKESLDQIYNPDTAQTYYDIRDILLDKENLTDEEQEDLQEALTFISGYEDYIKKLNSNTSPHALIESDLKALPKMIHKKPESVFMPITKVVNLAFDGKSDLFSEERDIIVSKKGETPQKKIKVQFFYSTEIEFPQKLDPFDREVFNGVCTLWESGQRKFTTNHVYEALTGKTTTDKKKLEKIDASILKLMTTLHSINWSIHAKMNRLPDENQEINRIYRTKNTNVLYLSQDITRWNNYIVTSYELLQEPPMLTYAKAVKQISVNNIALLDVPLNNSRDNIVLRGYLLRWIDRVKNKRSKVSNSLTYEKIFEDCYITGDRSRKKKKRDDITKMLDFWKEKNFIKNYSINKKGNAPYSISIIF